MTLTVERYRSDLQSEWDGLVRRSRNGLFLFERAYMDYHAHRFADFSAIAFQDNKPVALLPASWDPETGFVSSHAGLTFGGMVFEAGLRGTAAIEVGAAVLDELRLWGARELEVKVLPAFLASAPSQEMDWLLWRRGFQLGRRDLSSLVDLGRPAALNTSKKQSVAKAAKLGLEVEEGEIGSFHHLLAEVLGWRHGVSPVHSREELELLMERFPEQIRLRTVSRHGTLLAGVLVYLYPGTWHTQYMASSPEGRKAGALDFLIANLMEMARVDGARWLSFGTSTTNRGWDLNKGLLWQKESFGARSVTHDFLRGSLDS